MSERETHPDIRRTLLFLIKDDHILLALKKRGFGAGKWNGVGGKLEANETIEQALVRETEEEIGVTPLEYRKVAELDFLQEPDSPEPWHMYVHAYITESWNGEPIETEEMRPKWFMVDQIPYRDMWDDDEFWLPYVLKGEMVRGNFTFDKHDRMMSNDIRIVDSFTETAYV